MNDNLYVNANETLALLECMAEANKDNPIASETIFAIQELILDLKWKEIKE